MSRPPLRRSAAALAAATLLGACASRYDTAYHWAPRPREAAVHGAGREAGRVGATVLGVREGGAAGRAEIDVKLRVERFGDVPVGVAPDGLRLVTANRESLAPSEVRPVGPSVAAKGGAATFVATFPLPGRDPAVFDLSTLRLLVPVDVAGRVEEVRLPFERTDSAWLWIDPWGWPGTDSNGNPLGWRGDPVR
jgi:hypothetical protein